MFMKFLFPICWANIQIFLQNIRSDVVFRNIFNYIKDIVPVEDHYFLNRSSFIKSTHRKGQRTRIIFFFYFEPYTPKLCFYRVVFRIHRHTDKLRIIVFVKRFEFILHFFKKFDNRLLRSQHRLSFKINSSSFFHIKFYFSSPIINSLAYGNCSTNLQNSPQSSFSLCSFRCQYIVCNCL